MENKIQVITDLTRQRGSTTWILNAAIDNPNVIIVFLNHRVISEASQMYERLLKARPLYKRILWNLFGRKFPQFVSLGDARIHMIDSFKLPVVFDNSCFAWI